MQVGGNFLVSVSVSILVFSLHCIIRVVAMTHAGGWGFPGFGFSFCFGFSLSIVSVRVAAMPHTGGQGFPGFGFSFCFGFLSPLYQ